MVAADSRTSYTALLVTAAVVTLGVVASTIDSLTGGSGGRASLDFEPRGGGPQSNPGDVANNTGGQAGNITQEQVIDLVICVEELTAWPARIAILASVVLVLYGIYHRYNLSTSLLAGSGLVPVGWGLYFFLTNCGVQAGGGGGSLLSGTSIMTNEGGITSPPLPPELVAAVFLVVVVGGIGLLVAITGDDETFEPVADDQPEPETAAFARAAGRAADRIEATNVSVDNAVYEAWLEMTGLLHIDAPKTTAPRDFARAATGAGLEESDVAELTELFNEVRYGGRDAATREDRAVEILRTIERTYQDGTETPTGDS